MTYLNFLIHHDSMVDRVEPGVDLACELDWLPIVGPSATVLLQKVCALATHETAYRSWLSITVRELGGHLGLNERMVERALDRLVMFHLVERLDNNVFVIEQLARPLSERHINRVRERVPGFKLAVPA